MWVFVGEFLFSRICFLGLIGFSTVALGQSVTLSLGSGQGTPGGSVVLPITITSTGAQAAGVQWKFTYSADITGVIVALGSSGVSSQKSLECNGNLCLVSGLSGTIIPDGTVAIATFQIAANPSAQTIPIQITGVGASTAAANSIPASGVSGTITVSVSVQPILSGTSLHDYHLEYTWEYIVHRLLKLSGAGGRIRSTGFEQQYEPYRAPERYRPRGTEFRQFQCHCGASEPRPSCHSYRGIGQRSEVGYADPCRTSSVDRRVLLSNCLEQRCIQHVHGVA